jgi:hypothetical protein
LTIWATQGVRVTTAGPLYFAIQGGFSEVVRLLVQQMGAGVNQNMRLLVTELGVDVNQALPDGTPLILALRDGTTPLMVAARRDPDDVAVVRCLVELGADVGVVDEDGNTALVASVGRFETMRYLLEEAGANVEDSNNFGNNVWEILKRHLEMAAIYQEEVDPAALTSLLRVMVLRSAPPPALVALLSPEDTAMVQEGARLRARLPAYLAHRRAYLDSRCPRISLLPGVLRALIYGFEAPGTTEELWATGLGQAT